MWLCKKNMRSSCSSSWLFYSLCFCIKASLTSSLENNLMQVIRPVSFPNDLEPPNRLTSRFNIPLKALKNSPSLRTLLSTFLVWDSTKFLYCAWMTFFATVLPSLYQLPNPSGSAHMQATKRSSFFNLYVLCSKFSPVAKFWKSKFLALSTKSLSCNCLTKK